MAGEGPREWSPRNTVWAVLIDSQQGFDAEVFRTELKAYRFAVDKILDEDIESMEARDAKDFRKAEKKGHLDEAMEVYDFVMGEYGGDRKMTFYSIIKKELQ